MIVKRVKVLICVAVFAVVHEFPGADAVSHAFFLHFFRQHLFYMVTVLYIGNFQAF